MISTRLKFAAAAAMIWVSPAEARDVDLSRLPPSVVAATEKMGPVEFALREHLQSFGQPSDAFDFIGETVAVRQSATSCLGKGYLRTWWLPPEVEKRRAAYFQAMSEIACENDLPASLLDAVVAQESGYKAWAVSGAGAMGMMQVMPGTARHLELWNPLDPLANMRAGARYLRQQLNRFGRVDLALAAYNAGPERQSLMKGYVPAIPETQNYVRNITTNWVRLTQLRSPNLAVAARTAAANIAVRASGYREVSVTTYERINAENPI